MIVTFEEALLGDVPTIVPTFLLAIMLFDSFLLVSIFSGLSFNIKGLCGLFIIINIINVYLMAPPARIELITYRLEGGCSIQLSYGDA